MSTLSTIAIASDSDMVGSNSMVRKFAASDKQQYTWTFTGTEDAEWTVRCSRSEPLFSTAYRFVPFSAPITAAMLWHRTV